MTWLANLFANFGGYIVAALALVGGVFAAWFGGQKIGEAKESEKNAKDNAREEIQQVIDQAKVEANTIKGTTDAKDEVNRLDSGAAADELRENWSRD
jgi:predicted DNA repair protein MutK